MRKVIGIGETILDIIFRDEQPSAAVPGGSVFNGIVSLGRTGVPVCFISETGNDRVGNLILRFMRENHIPTDHVNVFPDGKSPVSLAFLDEHSDAEYIFYKNYPAQRLDVTFPEVKKDDVVVLGSYYALNPVLRDKVLELLDRARTAGAIVYYDPNFRAPHKEEAIKLAPTIIENLEYANIVRGSEEDFFYMYGLTDADRVYKEKIKFYCPNFLCTSGGGQVCLRTARFAKDYPDCEIVPVQLFHPAEPKTHRAHLYEKILDEKIREYLGKGYDIVLMGYSFSAALACKMQNKYAGKIKKLILVAPIYDTIVNHMIEGYVKYVLKFRRLSKKYGHAVAKAMGRTTTKGMIGLLLSILRSILFCRGYYKKVSCDTIIIRGDDDELCTTHSLHKVRYKMKNRNILYTYHKMNHGILKTERANGPVYEDVLSYSFGTPRRIPTEESVLQPVRKERKVKDYRQKIASIKEFDPACGSGNVLITAYKELCHLDMRAISMIDELPFVGIRLDNFHGIEIDDFPCEIARLSLWLAQHQINMECYEKYGNANPTLPLTETGHIVCGNALRLDWNEACPAGEDDTVYVCGNPPYAGGGGDTIATSQKNDMLEVFHGELPHGRLDYIACWFYLGAKYIHEYNRTKVAFVTTNSITQGVQVVFWKWVYKFDVEISFAYNSFKWTNNAAKKAGVTVTIIGLSYPSDSPHYLYSNDSRKLVSSIGPYLVPNVFTIVEPKTVSSTGYEMIRGTMFTDGGNLILSTQEKKDLLAKYPEIQSLIKPLLGSEEFIKGKERWCLWITDTDYAFAVSFPEIAERIENVKKFRSMSKAKTTRQDAAIPWKPNQIEFVPDSPCIIIPLVSSERRDYIPIGYLLPNTVVTNLAYTVYNAPMWLFAILTSRIHLLWDKTVAGRLKTDYRYSNTLCYNTFPFPTLSDAQKKTLEESAMRILEARENHYENTMAQLYDPDKMPDDLRAAHESNDLLVDSLYRKSGFDNDSERLQELFRRYKEAVK